MAATKTTILIAAYNAEFFISTAIYSALAQTLPPTEILVVDDASTDGTCAVVEKLAAENSITRLIKLPVNSGPSLARNTGIDAARGDWIAILDADDAFLPDRMEEMMKIILEKNADIGLGNFYYHNPTTGFTSEPALRYGDPQHVDVYVFLGGARPFLPEADIGLTKPVFRKTFLHDARIRYPVNSRHGEDFLLMVNALLASANCYLIRNAGYLYTVRASGFSRTIVDYETMIKHSCDLMVDKRIAGDTRMVASLKRRIRALRKHPVSLKFDALKKNGDHRGLITASLYSIDFTSLVVDALAKKIFRRLKKYGLALWK